MKKSIGYIILIAVCGFIFLISFVLYHLPVKAVIYPSGICAVLVVCYFTADFLKDRKKHKTLRKLLNLPENMSEILSEYDDVTDTDYQEIIRLMKEKEQRMQYEYDVRFSDMIDYYTTWVHQIKTPIASMKLTLQNEDTVFSRKLLEELFRIEQYVNMVLTYLRLDSDSSDYVFAEYSLDDIIRQAVRKYAGQFIGHGIKLDYTPVEKNIVTDEKWLLFVIEQIISNALKYTVSGCVNIYMEEPCILCIKDTGIGISSEDLPRIFEKGYTGYNGRNDKKASGLGLYLCKRISDNLGCGITAESEPDKGTTVKLDFTACKSKRH